MQDLQEVTHEIHYENYRSEKLGSQYKKNKWLFIIYKIDRNGFSFFIFLSNSVKDSVTNGSGEIVILDTDRMLKEKEEELRKMQEMVAKMQAQMMQAQLGEQNKTFAN